MEERVMIVDDEPDIRISVRTVLEEHGYEVLMIDSGEACLEALENGFRGVILMDIMMPGMDGWDTIREMIDRKLIEGNVIAMLTAKEDPDVDLEELAEAVINYIRKPFRADMLVSVVERYCKWLEDAGQSHPAG